MEQLNYGGIVEKMANKAQAASMWPVDSLVEMLVRIALKELYIDTCDTHGPMAADIRTICYKYLADRGKNNLEGVSADSTLKDSLKAMHDKWEEIRRPKIIARKIRAERKAEYNETKRRNKDNRQKGKGAETPNPTRTD